MSEALEKDDIQGLVAWGYGHLPSASWHLLRIADRRKAAKWLKRTVPLVTTAEGDSPRDVAVNVALAPSGLQRLGLDASAFEGFSTEFRGGMTTGHRQRVLGDVGPSREPSRWSWGGPATPAVDLVVLLYAADEPALVALQARVLGDLAATGLAEVKELQTTWLGDREHFGFHDGIAQPSIDGLRSGRGEDTIAPGEFILGYENEYGRRTDRPLLDRSLDPDGVLPPAAGHGKDAPADFGRNGSYLVVRQLGQDVPGFWRFADAASRTNGGRSAGSPEQAREALAARIVGRWPSGAPLTLAPDADDPRLAGENDFGYHHADAAGLRCPIGAHVRRANPRDSLEPKPGTSDSIAVNKRHRILRRSRTYGEPLTPEQALTTGTDEDADPRGLFFAAICGNLARQFEFVQHTWINNPKFAGLYEDPDPLLGPAGATLTIQARPVRRRVTSLPEFVSVHGGGYFFLPGVRALRYLAAQA